MTLNKETTYTVNPEFDNTDKDTYKLDSEAIGGAFFHRYVDGKHEASELAWFNAAELDQGVLV